MLQWPVEETLPYVWSVRPARPAVLSQGNQLVLRRRQCQVWSQRTGLKAGHHQ